MHKLPRFGISEEYEAFWKDESIPIMSHISCVISRRYSKKNPSKLSISVLKPIQIFVLDIFMLILFLEKVNHKFRQVLLKIPKIKNKIFILHFLN